MSDPATRPIPQTDMAILREIERITTRIGSPDITELEIALLMAHIPNIVREYRIFREPPATRVVEECKPAPPQLHLVSQEERRT